MKYRNEMTDQLQNDHCEFSTCFVFHLVVTSPSSLRKQRPAVLGGVAELLFDPQQLVVLRHAVAAARREPVLIWPVPRATARSAIVASSVSPLRWLVMLV